jgi:hypothetical protein
LDFLGAREEGLTGRTISGEKGGRIICTKGEGEQEGKEVKEFGRCEAQ